MGSDHLLSRRARTLILVLTLATLVGSVAAALYGSHLPGVAGRVETSAFSSGPLGHQGLYRSLAAWGREVHRLRSVQGLDSDGLLLFIEPRLQVEMSRGPMDLAEVVEKRINEELPTVVVLPKWRLNRGPLGRKKADLVESERVERVLTTLLFDQHNPARLVRTAGNREVNQEVALARPGLVESMIVSTRGRQLVALPGQGGRVLVGDRRGALALRWPDARGPLLLISDPDLLANFNFQRQDNFHLLACLLTDLTSPRPILVDELFHGLEKCFSLWEELGNFPQVLIPIHLLLLLLTLLVVGLRRFGPAHVAPPRTGRGPGEVVAVTANLLARGEGPGRLAGIYIDTVLDNTLAILELPRRESGPARAALLDRAARSRGVKPRAGELDSAARRLREGKGGLTIDHQRMARVAWQFRHDLVTANRTSGGGRRNGDQRK